MLQRLTEDVSDEIGLIVGPSARNHETVNARDLTAVREAMHSNEYSGVTTIHGPRGKLVYWPQPLPFLSRSLYLLEAPGLEACLRNLP
jgi:hypothetical protein